MSFSVSIAAWARRYFSPPKGSSRLLFVFQGRQGFRVGMGRGLYASENVFRRSIDRCAEVIEKRLGVDLALGFCDSDAAERAQSKEFHSILTHGLLHIGLAELWKSKGVEPDATIGLSLGEMTSTVAAGALTPEEAITVVQSAAQWDERLLARGKLLLVEADRARASALCHASPARLEYFAEYGPTTSVVFCAAEDVAQISSFLGEHGIRVHLYRGDYAYHTPRFATCKDLMHADLAHLRPRPSVCPFYSSQAGGVLPATTFFDASYWYWMLAQPVWFNTAFEAALSDGYDVVLNIGPHPSLDPHLRAAAAKLGKAPVFLDSLRDDEPEERSFVAALDRLRALGLASGRASFGAATARVSAATVDFSAEGAIRDPYPLLAGLRAQGSVHFLERHGYWIVLGYDEVMAALRQPDLFSSAPARGLDAVLLGANPEQHARVRRILAPCFKSAQDVVLGAEIAAIADQLLGQVVASERFDLVEAFAIPLSERVAACFIGLTDAHVAQLLALISTRRWVLDYIPAVNAFFTGYAERAASGAQETLLGRLTSGCGEKLDSSEAASILKLMWVAGTTTTGMLIASATRFLLYQPDVRAEILADRELVPKLIEETLRLDPPEQTVWRRAERDAILGGTRIPQGAEVRLNLATANRDPAYHENAACFVLRRPKQANLAFGGGIHQCIGAGLARLAARVAIERLVAYFPHMQALVPENHLRYVPSDHFRALASLPIVAKGATK